MNKNARARATQREEEHHTEITFLASPRSPKPFPLGNYDAVKKPVKFVNPSFIGDVYKTLIEEQGVKHVGKVTRAEAPEKRLLVRVASLEEIGTWLANYFSYVSPLYKWTSSEKVRVQIIGHSTSGSLNLGSGWENKFDPVVRPYVALTSTPAALNGWMQFRNRIKDVTLVGCLIGAWQTNGSPINGRTLTFALAELWACQVRGASVIVKGTDFKDGMYDGPKLGWSWTDPANPTLERKDERTDVYTPIGLPVPTAVRGPAGMLDPDQIKTFVDYFCCRVDNDDDQPHLAIPEVRLTLDYKNEKKPKDPPQTLSAALLCNGLFLVVDDNGTQRFYCHQGLTQSDALSSLIAILRFKSPAQGRAPSARRG